MNDDAEYIQQAAVKHGAMLPAEIVEQYRAIQARPVTPPPVIHHAPQSVDLAKIAKGGGLLLASAGVVYVGAVTIVAIASAAVLFIQTYALVIGGSVVGVLGIAIVFSRSGERGTKHTPSGGGPVVINQYNNFGQYSQSTNQTNVTN